jgi:hypothetical protein
MPSRPRPRQASLGLARKKGPEGDSNPQPHCSVADELPLS